MVRALGLFAVILAQFQIGKLQKIPAFGWRSAFGAAIQLPTDRGFSR